MLQPFSAIFKRKSGATHRSPYDRDTHVPLVFYREGALQRKRVIEKVWVPQFTVTLSKILGICKPSASRYEVLPGV